MWEWVWEWAFTEVAARALGVVVSHRAETVGVVRIKTVTRNQLEDCGEDGPVSEGYGCGDSGWGFGVRGWGAGYP